MKFCIDGQLRRLFIVMLCLFSTGVKWSSEQDMFYFDPAPVSQDVNEGDELTLRCDVSNRRMISFYWTFNGRPLANNSRRFQENSDLRLLHVDRNLDNGSFRCVAVNVSTGIAVRSAEAKLNIMWIDADVEVELKQPAASEGVDLLLRCHVEGNPEPNIEWFRNRIKLFSNDRIRPQKNRIKINSITFADNGVYSCRARNEAGQVESIQNFILSVKDAAATIPTLNQSSFTSVVIAKQLSTAVFHCQYIDALSTQWSFDQLHLANTTKYKILNNGTLFVNHVDADDVGTYRCVGVNSNGNEQVFVSQLLLAFMNDLSESSFDPRPILPLVVPIGGKVEVRCLLPRGLPKPTLRWHSPSGSVVMEGGRMKVTPDGMITIVPVEETDAGNYSCVVENMSGIKSKSFTLVVSVPPRILKSPSFQTVVEGDGGGASFECKFSSTPFPATTVVWKKDGQIIDQRNGRFKTSQGLLTISDVQLADEGDYNCMVITKGHPSATSVAGHLYVSKRLQFRPLPMDAKLELNSNSSVSCHADGSSAPAIQWHKIGHVLPSHVHSDVSTGALTFYGVHRSDAGLYICLASNNQGTINTTVRIDVVVKPVFITRPANTTARIGEPVLLHCSSYGEPVPTVQWDKNGRIDLFDLSRIKMLDNGSMLIWKALIEDSGRYGCRIDNGGGIERQDVYLHVDYLDLSASVNDLERSDDQFMMTKTIIIAVCSVVAYIAAMIAIAIYCLIRRMRRKANQQNATGNGYGARAAEGLGGGGERGGGINETTQLMKRQEKDALMSSKSDADSSQSSSQNSHPLSRYRHHYENGPSFPRQQLQIHGLLGKCHYGDVLLAQNHMTDALHTLVCVKSLLSSSNQHLMEFEREIELMIKCNHENVARFVGLCSSIQPPLLILEYCEWGDLKQFLLNLNGNNHMTSLSLYQQLEMCRQISLGMEHLSINRLVHRDLAARNIVVTPSLDIKISSLCLCRDIYASDYYLIHDRLVPLRWSPAESVFDDDYSTQSDVWSFGVVFIEIFSFGVTPLLDKTDEEVIAALRSGATRLHCPSLGCPEPGWRLVQRCTQVHPSDRPSFSEITRIVADMVSSCTL